MAVPRNIPGVVTDAVTGAGNVLGSIASDVQAGIGAMTGAGPTDRDLAAIMSDASLSAQQRDERARALRQEQRRAQLMGASKRAPAPENFVQIARTSEESIGKPDGSVDFVPKQGPQQRGPGDFGLGAAQAMARRSGRDHRQTTQGIQAQQTELTGELNKQLEARQLVEAGEQTEVMEHMAHRQRAALESADEIADIESRRKTIVEDYGKRLDNLRSEAKYFNLDPQDRQRAMDVLKDPSIPDGDPRKQKAQESLDRGAQINPTRVLEGAGNKILAVIANVLGGIGAGITGGPNMGYEAIRAAIDDDIMTQKAKRDDARQAIKDERGMYTEALQQLGDEQLATLAVRDAKLQAANNAIETAQFKYGKVRDITGLEELKIRNEQERLSNEQAYADRAHQIAMQEAGLSAQISGQRAHVDATKAKAGRGGGKIIGSADARSLGELKAAEQMMRDLFKAHGEKTGPMSWLAQYLPTTDAKNYENRRRVAAQIVGGILEGGKLADVDYERHLESMPSASDTKATAKAKMDAINNMLRQQGASMIDAFQSLGYATGNVDFRSVDDKMRNLAQRGWDG